MSDNKIRPLFRIKAKLKEPGSRFPKEDFAAVWPFENSNGKRGWRVQFAKDAVIDHSTYYYTMFENDWEKKEESAPVVGGLDDLD